MGPPAGPADSWGVHNGKLYMNFRPDIKRNFFKHIDANIEAGNARWISLWGDLRAGPFNTDCLAQTWSAKNCADSPQAIPGINPSPSPSPSPPSGECATTVQGVCKEFIGNINACVNCCEFHSGVVKPACPHMSDVRNACQGDGIVV